MWEVDLRKLPLRLGPGRAWDVRSWDLTERKAGNDKPEEEQPSRQWQQRAGPRKRSRLQTQRWHAVPKGPRRGEDTDARPVSSAPGSRPLPPRPSHGASCGAWEPGLPSGLASAAPLGSRRDPPSALRSFRLRAPLRPSPGLCGPRPGLSQAAG